MTNPLVSVLMPVYNAERYVAEAVQSILDQTFTDFEFLIVDDGSTDKSLKILQKFAQQDPRIRLISRPNTGIVGALNEMLKLSKGEFLARMDGDDVCDPSRFERQLCYMSENPGIVAVGSSAISIDPDGDLIGDAILPLDHDSIESAHLSGRSSIFHPAVMMRQNTVNAVGGYRNEAFPCEDFDLWLRLGEIGKLANLPEKLLYWRRTDTGIVATKSALIESKIQWILNETWKRRNLTTDPVLPVVKELQTIDLYRQWAWTSLNSGNIRTARKYGIRCFLSQPWSKKSLVLLYCTLRGY
jgi:glycosyltransferase involved in cell wall biosynthesis